MLDNLKIALLIWFFFVCRFGETLAESTNVFEVQAKSVWQKITHQFFSRSAE